MYIYVLIIWIKVRFILTNIVIIFIQRSNHSSASQQSKAIEARGDSSSGVSPLRSENRIFINSNEKINNTTLCNSDAPFKASYDISYKTKSLTEPFKEYLISRSVLTASPIDLSILNKSDADEKISDSLMYCLDGNIPSDLTSSVSNLAVSNDNPLKCNVNIDLSPNKKMCVKVCNSIEKKKSMVGKENIEQYELRETDL